MNASIPADQVQKVECVIRIQKHTLLSGIKHDSLGTTKIIHFLRGTKLKMNTFPVAAFLNWSAGKVMET